MRRRAADDELRARAALILPDARNGDGRHAELRVVDVAQLVVDARGERRTVKRHLRKRHDGLAGVGLPGDARDFSTLDGDLRSLWCAEGNHLVDGEVGIVGVVGGKPQVVIFLVVGNRQVKVALVGTRDLFAVNVPDELDVAVERDERRGEAEHALRGFLVLGEVLGDIDVDGMEKTLISENSRGRGVAVPVDVRHIVLERIAVAERGGIDRPLAPVEEHDRARVLQAHAVVERHVPHLLDRSGDSDSRDAVVVLKAAVRQLGELRAALERDVLKRAHRSEHGVAHLLDVIRNLERLHAAAPGEHADAERLQAARRRKVEVLELVNDVERVVADLRERFGEREGHDFGALVGIGADALKAFGERHGGDGGLRERPFADRLHRRRQLDRGELVAELREALGNRRRPSRQLDLLQVRAR